MANILFIEDDPLILKIYSTRLSADGHVVETAGNGEEGVERATAKAPDLIVLDIMMPKMDGFAVLQKLRSNQTLAQIPILVYSNLGREEEMAKARQLGATETIIKANISPTDMVNKIKQYVSSLPQEGKPSQSEAVNQAQVSPPTSPTQSAQPAQPATAQNQPTQQQAVETNTQQAPQNPPKSPSDKQ